MAALTRCCALLLCFHLARVVLSGETNQFYIELQDLLDPDWVMAQYDAIGTKIKCASLCFQNKGSCAYFGFLNHTCYLLKDNVDQGSCSKDSCEASGMKVYKWKQDVTTTMQPPTTTTTTEKPTTTTTELPTTTTTAEPTTTTTEAATTTTTTESPTTTTTESPTTTTTEATTTTAEPTTTTTEETTTTTEIMTTTTEATTTTTEGFTCEPPDGQEVELVCPMENHLVNGIGSRSPFFNDAATSAKCEDNLREVIYGKEEEIRTFFSLADGITIKASCPDENQIIVKLKACFKDLRIPRIILHCRYIKDPGTIEDRYDVSSKDSHQLVQCGKNTGAQKLYFEKSETEGVTKVTFTCVQIYQEDSGPAAPDAPPAPAPPG